MKLPQAADPKSSETGTNSVPTSELLVPSVTVPSGAVASVYDTVVPLRTPLTPHDATAPRASVIVNLSPAGTNKVVPMPPDGIVCAQAFFAVYCASESPLPGVPVPAPCATDVPKAMPPTRTPPARNAPNAATFGLLNMVFPPCLCGEEPSASAPPNLWAESCTRSGACSAGDRHRWFGPPILLPMANHLGTIVAKAKHLDEASLTSRQLQAALLPEVPGFLPGIRLYASYSAASESLDVGGDFYDVVPTPDGPIWLIIGDIEGHDRRAAAQMGQLRSAIRTLILQGLAPEDIIDELRRVWSFLGLTKTATLFPGQPNSSTGQLATASAGHPPPLLVSGASADFGGGGEGGAGEGGRQEGGGAMRGGGGAEWGGVEGRGGGEGRAGERGRGGEWGGGGGDTGGGGGGQG